MTTPSKAEGSEAITKALIVCQRAGYQAPVLDRLLEAKLATVRERLDSDELAHVEAFCARRQG